MRTGTMPAFPLDLDLQFSRCCGEAPAADTHAAPRQIRHHMHAEKGVQPVGGAGIPHPHRPLCQLLRRLKQQTHPEWQLFPGPQQPCHTKSDAGVQVMAAGVHHPLTGGGKGETGALLHRQGIHIHPQTNRGAIQRTGFCHNPRASYALLNAPAAGPQLSSHQGCRLMLLAAELRVGMQMSAQLDQLGQGLIQAVQQLLIQHRQRSSKARKAISCWVGCGGQRRTSSSQSFWR